MDEYPTEAELDEAIGDFETPEYLTLDYEDGTSERCEVLGIFACGEREYVALVPESDDESVYLYAYDEHEDGTFSLLDIEDDEEFAAVSAVYEDLMGDEE